VDRNTETVILGFFCSTGGILETQALFPKANLHINPYLHICPLSWALGIFKNIGIRTYFGSVAVESVKVFRHFVFWRHGTRLATFFIAPAKCIFWGISFEPIKNLATLVPEKLQGLHGTPLYYCYTLPLTVCVWCPNRLSFFIYEFGDPQYPKVRPIQLEHFWSLSVGGDMTSRGFIRWVRMCLASSLHYSVRSAWIADLESRTSPSTCGQCIP